ncbi:GntR family transcriptional regulator [Roseivivax sp. CAU 1761]
MGHFSKSPDLPTPPLAGPGRPARPAFRKASVSQQIHDALRARILALELAPGQNLSRNEIAEFYGVSQTPVRDAMMKLEEEGLLAIFPQSKTQVSRIDVDQARETQFLRLALEVEIARRLAEAGAAAALQPARTVLAQQRAALEVGDLDGFARGDRDFHRALFAAAGVERLWTLILERSGHIDRLRQLNLPDPGKAGEIVDYHTRILDHLAEGDGAAAERAVRGHLTGTLAQVDRIIARHPEFF